MHSQLEALLVLLFDTDGFVSESAYQALVGMGRRVLPNLQQYADHATNISTFEQELVEDVIFDIHLNKISHQLEHWAAFRSHDLWEGLCLVNNIICPELSFHNAKKMLDIIYQTMHNKITPLHTPNKSVCYMNEIFFKEQQYKAQNDRSNPQLYFVSDVISGHLGSDLLITAIYYLLARRLQLGSWLFELDNNIVMLGFENTRQYKYTSPLEKSYKIGFYLYPPQEGRRYLLSEITPDAILSRNSNAYLPINHVRLLQLIIENLAITYQTNHAIKRSKSLSYTAQQLTPFALLLP